MARARAAGVLALGVAACGSDDRVRRRLERQLQLVERRQAGRHHQRCRRDVPAARLRPSGPRASRTSTGTTVNYQADRLGRRHRPVHGRHRRLRRHRRGDEARGGQAAAKKKGDPGPRPDRARRGHGLLQRRAASTRASSSTAPRSPTSSSARSRSGTTRRSRSSTPARACRTRTSRSATAPTSRARRRTSRRSSPTTRPSGRAVRASTRRSSGRPAPAPRATTASPAASSRPTARWATSSRPTRCRTTSRPPP